MELFIHRSVVPLSDFTTQTRHGWRGSCSPQLYSQLYWDCVYRQQNKKSVTKATMMTTHLSRSPGTLTRHSITSTKSLAFINSHSAVYLFKNLILEHQPTATSSPPHSETADYGRSCHVISRWENMGKKKTLPQCR
jgi:hypothetical protein